MIWVFEYTNLIVFGAYTLISVMAGLVFHRKRGKEDG